MVGFAVLKRYAAGSTQPFGPHENNIVQTVATASGGMSNVFISGIPALYQLGLLRTPVQDFFRIVSLVAVGGYFGLLSVAPLRKLFIEDAARDLDLVFPSSMATAMSIHSMHSAADGEEAARPKLKATIYAFGAAMVLRVISQYAPGLLWEWHVFTWLANANIFRSLAIAAESWGWLIELSPAMMGSGMLVDFKVACSFFAGSVLAWYWLLWPGVICTLAVALAASARLVGLLMRYRPRSSGQYDILADQDMQATVENDKEAAERGLEEEDIATWMWAPGACVLVILAVLLTYWQFDMPLLESVLALVLSFGMSLVAIQATGATAYAAHGAQQSWRITSLTQRHAMLDTTPINSISKVSQAVLSGVTQATGGSIIDAQRLNLLGASLTNIGANQGVGDFRVGFLLRTPPRLQYAAQLIGTLVATLVAPSVFVLFATAYPCIIASPSSSEGETGARACEFPGPAIAAWRAVAVAASAPTSPVPPSSARFSAGLAVVSVLLVVVRRLVVVGAWRGASASCPT
ncbi:oligopeptide transporter [Colletotrichum higginsianum]|nr:oligopeptide transporter [Colletotrichum higginsianum]